MISGQETWRFCAGGTLRVSVQFWADLIKTLLVKHEGRYPAVPADLITWTEQGRPKESKLRDMDSNPWMLLQAHAIQFGGPG